MLFLFWLFLFILIALSENSAIDKVFSQNSFNVVLERGEVKWVDQKTIKSFKSWTFKHNRTATALNLNIVFNVDIQQMYLDLLAYKFSGNEYKRTGVKSSIDICASMVKDYFGLSVLHTRGNLTLCPIKKGQYTIPDWYPTESKFPPGLHSGNWKVEFKVIVNDVDAAHADLHFTVKYKKI